MNRLGLFAKYWTPGQVKTRLARMVGDQPATEIHRILLLYLLRELGGSSRGELPIEMDLVFTPNHERKKLEPFSKNWRLVPQCDGDLGKRLATYVNDAFANGAQRVILIGADCPFVSKEVVTDALRQLESAEVVLGPAVDGGYYLLGLAGPTIELFQRIEWSTDQVLEQTMAVVSKRNLVHSFLREKEDVDDFDSLTRIVNELQTAMPGTGQQHLARELEPFLQVTR